MDDSIENLKDAAPPDSARSVIALVERENGNRCRVHACYVRRHTVEDAFNEYEDEVCDYDEDTETYYLHEGWYEVSEFSPDYAYFAIDAVILAWTEMPQPSRR